MKIPMAVMCNNAVAVGLNLSLYAHILAINPAHSQWWVR